ncbi:hypothetical protein HDU93_005598, partial [Gonapodya sp. JEL0774]
GLETVALVGDEDEDFDDSGGDPWKGNLREVAPGLGRGMIFGEVRGVARTSTTPRTMASTIIGAGFDIFEGIDDEEVTNETDHKVQDPGEMALTETASHRDEDTEEVDAIVKDV